MSAMKDKLQLLRQTGIVLCLLRWLPAFSRIKYWWIHFHYGPQKGWDEP